MTNHPHKSRMIPAYYFFLFPCLSNYWFADVCLILQQTHFFWNVNDHLNHSYPKRHNTTPAISFLIVLVYDNATYSMIDTIAD